MCLQEKACICDRPSRNSDDRNNSPDGSGGEDETKRPRVQEFDELVSYERICEWERELQSLFDKLTKRKYKEYEPPRVQHFDVFNMKLKGYDKEKEQERLRKEEFSKSFTYRKLRSLYGTRPCGALLKGVLDSADDSVCTHEPDGKGN